VHSPRCVTFVVKALTFSSTEQFVAQLRKMVAAGRRRDRKPCLVPGRRRWRPTASEGFVFQSRRPGALPSR
jgi:hypothetical protein